MSQLEKLSPLEEGISLYYREEANRIAIPEGLSQRIVEKATSPAADKRIGRRGFPLAARGAMAAAITAAVLIWANVPQITSTVSAEEILQRVEETYQKGPTFGADPGLRLQLGPG